MRGKLYKQKTQQIHESCFSVSLKFWYEVLIQMRGISLWNRCPQECISWTEPSSNFSTLPIDKNSNLAFQNLSRNAKTFINFQLASEDMHPNLIRTFNKLAKQPRIIYKSEFHHLRLSNNQWYWCWSRIVVPSLTVPTHQSL